MVYLSAQRESATPGRFQIMSVTNFDFTELGNLAACCVEDHTSNHPRLMSVSLALAELSIVNTATYNAKNPGKDVQHATAPAILKEAWEALRAGTVGKSRGASTLRVLDYNCDFVGPFRDSVEALDIVRDSFLGCYGSPSSSCADRAIVHVS